MSNNHAHFIWSIPDLASSPTIQVEVEDALYAAAAGQSQAFKALLKSSDAAQIAAVVLAMGLYQKARSAAESEP